MYILIHGNMFRLYIQPSSGLKEIKKKKKNVYFMGCIFNHLQTLKKSVQVQNLFTLWDPIYYKLYGIP
jgi:hypothetical protein